VGAGGRALPRDVSPSPDVSSPAGVGPVPGPRLLPVADADAGGMRGRRRGRLWPGNRPAERDLHGCPRRYAIYIMAYAYLIRCYITNCSESF